MRITVIGRGHVGGALARRWTAAGHDVTALGRDGGDATAADVVVVAIPGDSIAVGLANIAGLDGLIAFEGVIAV
ncbi:NAD(P)-binding domain-containing protein [Arthrobacter sp. KNU-44]|uniref:NAD(P)-binding domain-containing protein n=1 Tax=unclassified Arthrobacter TaxID=235627 RepID=UPI003F426832